MSDEPFFFLHFPRTAGTTVDEIFDANFLPERILKIYSRADFQKYKFIDDEEIKNIKYITGHLLLSNVNPPQIYGKNVRAFTFLRDPVKRLFSEYIFLKTWKKQHLYEYLNSNKISFIDYITSSEQILKYRGKNFMTRCISGDALETSDLDKSLDKAMYNLKHNFIFFGIQNRFMESMLMLSKIAGLENILHQRRNSLNYGAIKEEMTAEEEDVARHYNSADVKLYEYALKLFDERVKENGEEFQKALKNYEYFNAKYQKLSNLLYKQSVTEPDQKNIELGKDIKW